ncbi:MAG: transposase, partial [Terriglobales bacterium]
AFTPPGKRSGAAPQRCRSRPLGLAGPGPAPPFGRGPGAASVSAEQGQGPAPANASAYRALVRNHFPNARIVADRFHVIRLVNRHLFACWRETGS